ncbi:MAG: Bax inhibitor-1/YccA family protein [Bacteroidaceae bacterium]|nr:Bax inhibitor-1/YccA family protein [Bacteroidaceae bacterium]
MEKGYSTQAQAYFQEVAAQRKFLVWVYRWMTIGLALTGIIAIFIYSNQQFLTYLRQSNWAFMGLIVAELALVFILVSSINRMSLTTAITMFLAYSALNGITLSAIIALYTASSVGYALFIAALMFGLMSIYGYYTKSDLTKFGNLLSMALIGLVIAFFINIFWFNSTVYWVISIIGIFIFVGLTAYDTQRLKQIGESAENLDTNYMKAGVIGALTLYLDFINIFFLLLGVSGRRS